MNPHWTSRWSFRWFRAVAVLMLLSFALPVVGATELPAAAQEKIDPAVRAQLTAQKESAVWVVMREKANLAPAYGMKNWDARGRFVVAQLQAAANRSQAGVKALLQSRGKGHKGFWIVNAIQTAADAATLADVAARPEVERIVLDGALTLPELMPATEQPQVDSVEWNIDRISAPQVWSAFGVKGEGVVVANIDSGVQYDHPALVGQYRGNAGGSFDHNYSWFDPTGICGDVPCDNNGHGTHTMGTMVGDDGAGNQIGVAPGARWIAAKGCEEHGCSYEALMASGQWILAPTDLNGDNPRVDLRPNVVNNSWGGGGSDFFYQGIVQAWVASGIFPQFSNGNAGEFGCRTAGSPGDYPESYAAGAFDINNTIAPFSSRGPANTTYETKPDIAAPGVDVRSSLPGNSYGSNSGTSMASPHVAGTVALMWAAAPSMIGDIALTRALLDQTAIDVVDYSCPNPYPPPPGPSEDNNVWGEGRLDAFLAVEQAPRGPVGGLAGMVSDATTGQPLAGATITIAGPYARIARADFNGVYRMRLPIGSYAVTASIFGYFDLPMSDVAVSEGVTTTLDFALVPAPSYGVSGTVRDERGGPLANAVVTILGTPISPATTAADGTYSFASVPEGAYDLQVEPSGCYIGQTAPLTVAGETSLNFALTQRRDGYGYFCAEETPGYIEGDTPVMLDSMMGTAQISLPFPFSFYGETYDRTYVARAGYVSFVDQYWYAWNEPIPSLWLPNAAIYAFWDELYLDYDSGVYTAARGEAPNRQFVIEWRNARFCCGTPEAVDVEIVLYENGEILTQYRNIDANGRERGDSATLGIENASGSDGLQFSANQPLIGVPSFAVRYDLPASGFVQGMVTDKNDGLPVAGATVQLLQGGGVVRELRTNADGFYRAQALVGAYDLTVSAIGYGEASASVTLAEDAIVTRDFALLTGQPVLSPTALEFVVPAGQTRTKAITLRNTGSAPLTWELKETGGVMVTTASTARLTRSPIYDPNASTTRGMFTDGEARGWSPTAPGNVLRSWSTSSLGWPTGIGYAQNVWLSDNYTRKNHEFTVEGAATGRSWQSSWNGDSLADMAYDPGRGLMCQLAVGGTNGIYCWDPATGDVAASITGSFPWTMTSQRGLAYRPDDDSFYVGGWYTGSIYHVAGLGHPAPGTVLSQCNPPDGSISGLAWNPAYHVLWVATNSYNDTIYQLNPDTCGVLGTLAHPNPGYNGGGLDMDDEGNLWMLGQNSHMAYLVESGVPAFNDVPWLSESPTSGAVAPGQAVSIQVTVNTAGMQAGTYNATLFLRNSSARNPGVRIPVSLVVPAYYQAVNAGGGAYTDTAGEVWAADKRFAAGGWGYTNATSQAATTKKAIAGTEDDRLFQVARESPGEYRFDGLPAGMYEVELRFADIRATRANLRIFDVFIENGTALPGYDIVALVGPLTADSYTFYVPVSDGQLNIRFAPRGKGYQPPIVSAIRVVNRPDR